MGRRCFVEDCKSGYKSCREKVSLFKAPNDPERLQAWAAAIPGGGRQLTSRDYVCEKHFTSNMIRRDKYYGEFRGEVILDHPKKPGLRPEAVPCIFLPSAASLTSSKKKPPVREASSNTSHATVKRSTGTSTAVDVTDVGTACEAHELEENQLYLQACDGDLPCATTSSSNPLCASEKQCKATTTPATDVQSCGSSSEQCLLHKLMKEKPVSLPSPAWNRHEISMKGVESICFAELWKASATSPAIMIKSLELAMCGEGLKVSQYVFEREVSSKVLKVPSGLYDVPDITELLDSFHKSVVCGGGPAKSKFLGIQLECATVDGLGFWRHRNCSLLLHASETQCRSCKSLDNTLRVHKARKEKRVKDTRIRLPVSPSKRPKLEALRRQCKHTLGTIVLPATVQS